MEKKQILKPVLIFVHVPKTAGTTFRTVLEKNYRKELVYETKWPNEIQDVKSFQQLPLGKRNS
jgi:hypothetical protein